MENKNMKMEMMDKRLRRLRNHKRRNMKMHKVMRMVKKGKYRKKAPEIVPIWKISRKRMPVNNLL